MDRTRPRERLRTRRVTFQKRPRLGETLLIALTISPPQPIEPKYITRQHPSLLRQHLVAEWTYKLTIRIQ
jgi:hypothetical protein